MTETAATTGVAAAFESIGKHIDSTIDRDKTDAVTSKAEWIDLQESLPQQGIGLDATMRELVERVLPMAIGCRIRDSSVGSPRGLPWHRPSLLPLHPSCHHNAMG